MDGLGVSEAAIFHTCKNGVNTVLWLWNGARIHRERRVGASSQELEAWCASTVGYANGAGELDEVSSCYIVTGQEWRESVDWVIDTRIGRVRKLGTGEKDDGSIRSSAPKRRGL